MSVNATVRTGLTRMVPKLKEIHIIRDAWMKLHVAPAKIMQVCKCMYMDMYTVYGYFYYCRKSVYCLSYIDMLMSIQMQHL